MDNSIEKQSNAMPSDAPIDSTEHVCEDENCECNSIILEMEDGTQKEFTIVDMIEHNEKQYIALAELESQYYDILRMEKHDSDYQLLEIEDDSEYSEISKIFEELLASDEEEE